MNFAPITLALHGIHAGYWTKTPLHFSDMTFTNLWGWAPLYGLEYAEAYGLFWIRRTKPEQVLWPPIGDWNTTDWEAVIADMPKGTRWERVPSVLYDELLDRRPQRITIEETRGQWEYLYARNALATLSGNRLHKKKNHFNAFRKSYGLDYRPMTSADIETMLRFQYDWCRYHECGNSPTLEMENEALIRVLTCWDDLSDLRAGALSADERIVAFSVGEPLDRRTFVVHFEKALPEYRGAYQAINLCFAKDAAKGFEFINREQDAGEDGLRQAKESYFPCGYIVKNRIIFN